jgi:carboxylate-amine ligase
MAAIRGTECMSASDTNKETSMPGHGTFHGNQWPTLGVEIELQLVDETTMALKSAIADILVDIPPWLRDSVKPEFMQCYVEINTDVCRTVADVESDLTSKIRVVEETAARHDTRLFWAGTHPFSRWRDQQITPNERYYMLADRLQETVIRPVTFGLHVHVGVETGDKAIMIGDRLTRYLPLLLAVSANSPFWHARKTGHHAHRIEVLEGFPTGGLPPKMQTWDDYQSLVHQLQTGTFIESERELWWDVRPSAANGTIEVRICDMPPSLEDVVGLTALIQCLVRSLSNEIDKGIADHDIHPLVARQNRWRACRYGLDAMLVDPDTMVAVPARIALERLVRTLRPVARGLGCHRELRVLSQKAAGDNGALRQIAIHERSGDLAEMVRVLTDASSLREPPRRRNSGHGSLALRAGADYPSSYRTVMPSA